MRGARRAQMFSAGLTQLQRRSALRGGTGKRYGRVSHRREGMRPMGRGDSSDRTNRTPNVWRLEVALGEADGPHVLSPPGVCPKLPRRREHPGAIAPSF